MLPYWIADSLKGLPLYLFVYLGIGVPWALAVLPGPVRRDRAIVLAAAFAFGAALMTAWMFILGTVGAVIDAPLLRLTEIALGGVLIAAAGLLLALRRSRTAEREQSAPRGIDEKILIVLVVAALLTACAVILYWPFTAYDTLWVYGYQGRLYALTGVIPHSIDYYPQFLPLQYALAQLDGIDDHAARAVVPLIHLGAILAAYTLGKLIDGRRAGVYLAALWALYPHVGEWSRAGDLEIPLTLSFTLASAFFLKAWIAAGDWGGASDVAQGRRSYAALAGVMFGIALWTKPTAGAFALGVALLVGLEALRQITAGRRGAALLRGVVPRLEVAVITALTCVPLGGVWYARNLVLGHNVVDFPPSYWQTLAERGGDDLSLPLVAILVAGAFVMARDRRARRLDSVLGVAFMLGAVARSLLAPESLEARRMTGIELILFIAGAGLIYRSLVVCYLRRFDDVRAHLLPIAARLGWAAALALPYFAVWFYAYSYHYRLSFPVVPLLLLPAAVVLARWLRPEALRTPIRRLSVGLLLTLAALPGIISPIPDKFAGSTYLFDESMPDDTARYRSGNAALMTVVDGLKVWKDDHPGEPLIVSAPGVVRLPFFFPLDAVRTRETPRSLDEIAEAVYFVYGVPESSGAYEAIPFFQNQVVNALGRQEVIRRAWGLDDGIFRYDVYELHLARRWERPEPHGVAPGEVMFGDFARYLGWDIGGLDLWPGRRVILHLYFEVTGAASGDYSIYVHLVDPDGALIASWDNPTGRTALGYYAAPLWQPGEFITDQRVVQLPDVGTRVGDGYRLIIGFYDPATNQRVPVTLDGIGAGDGWVVTERISIVPPRE